MTGIGLFVGCGGETPNAPLKPDRLVAVSDTAWTDAIGSTREIRIRVVTGDDRGMRGVSVLLGVEAGGGSVTRQQASTDTLGYVTVAWTLGPRAGPNVLHVRTSTLATQSVQFHATAIAAVLRVSINVLGNGSDPDGFVATVDGQAASVNVGSTAVFGDLPGGPHRVSLSGIAAHCFLDEPDASPSVKVGDTASVQFSVECHGDFVFQVYYSIDDGQIFYLSPTGEITRLTTLPGQNVPEQWSPDGSRIAFRNTYAGNSDIYTVRPDATGLTRITYSPDQDLQARWSPDGRRLAYFRYATEGSFSRPTIHIVNADGSAGDTVLDTLHENRSPSWSPDGSRIMYACSIGLSQDICSIGVDGTDFRRIVSVPGAYNSLWSPDGSRVAFLAFADGQQRAWSVKVDGSELVKLNPASVSYSFAWSPDGKQLMLSISGGPGDFDLARVNADGTGLTPLGVDPASGTAAWSPDGRKIATDLFTDTGRWLVVMNPDGTQMRRFTSLWITAAGGIWNPRARPGAGLQNASTNQTR